MRFLILAAILSVTLPAYAAPLDSLSEDQLKRVANNVGMDATFCTMFFKIAAECIENTPQSTADYQSLLTKFSSIRDSMMQQMTIFNAAAGMNEEGMKARILDVNDELQKDIGNNCANIAVIRRKYLDQCLAMYQNPDSRIAYWQNKIYP